MYACIDCGVPHGPSPGHRCKGCSEREDSRVAKITNEARKHFKNQSSYRKGDFEIFLAGYLSHYNLSYNRFNT